MRIKNRVIVNNCRQQLIINYQIIGFPPKMQNIIISESEIQKLCHSVNQEITVQVISIKKMKKENRFTCDLSDGSYKISAIIIDNKITEICQNALIAIISYEILEFDEKFVGLVDQYRILGIHTEKLGQPVYYLKGLKNGENGNNKKKTLIELQKLKYNNMQNSSTYQNFPAQKINTSNLNLAQDQGDSNIELSLASSEVKMPIKYQQNENQQLSYNIKKYEKISDLYPNFPNWQLGGRLIKKNYNEFVSQKGKLIKLLHLQIMDVNGMKINGTMFGESAKKYNNSLKEKSIYIFSKGQIKEQYNQNQNKGKNYSMYELAFNSQSLFNICKDDDVIPHLDLCDLLYISQNLNQNQTFDVIAILLSIKEQIQIPKDNKIYYYQTLQICDPIHNLMMYAVIWNRSLEIDEKDIGKTIGLFSFKLREFNERMELNSSFNSQLKLMQNYKYNEYEGKINREKLKMIEMSATEKDTDEQSCKNLKDLQNEFVYLDRGAEIKSALNLTISFINHKNWWYESCPYCRKKGEGGTICTFCENQIKETIPRYKLNVELSDCSRCISVVGFDELGSKLFGDCSEIIKNIKQLSDDQRRRLFELKQNQQYLFKLSSKRYKANGEIKSRIIKIYDCNFLSRSQENLKKIQNYLQ